MTPGPAWGEWFAKCACNKCRRTGVSGWQQQEPKHCMRSNDTQKSRTVSTVSQSAFLPYQRNDPLPPALHKYNTDATQESMRMHVQLLTSYSLTPLRR